MGFLDDVLTVISPAFNVVNSFSKDPSKSAKARSALAIQGAVVGGAVGGVGGFGAGLGGGQAFGNLAGTISPADQPSPIPEAPQVPSMKKSETTLKLEQSLGALKDSNEEMRKELSHPILSALVQSYYDDGESQKPSASSIGKIGSNPAMQRRVGRAY